METHKLVGKDYLDSATDNIPFDKIPDYEAACQKDALGGVRVAVSLRNTPFCSEWQT